MRPTGAVPSRSFRELDLRKVGLALLQGLWTPPTAGGGGGGGGAGRDERVGSHTPPTRPLNLRSVSLSLDRSGRQHGHGHRHSGDAGGDVFDSPLGSPPSWTGGNNVLLKDDDDDDDDDDELSRPRFMRQPSLRSHHSRASHHSRRSEQDDQAMLDHRQECIASDVTYLAAVYADFFDVSATVPRIYSVCILSDPSNVAHSPGVRLMFRFRKHYPSTLPGVPPSEGRSLDVQVGCLFVCLFGWLVGLAEWVGGWLISWGGGWLVGRRYMT